MLSRPNGGDIPSIGSDGDGTESCFCVHRDYCLDLTLLDLALMEKPRIRTSIPARPVRIRI